MWFAHTFFLFDSYISLKNIFQRQKLFIYSFSFNDHIFGVDFKKSLKVTENFSNLFFWKF